MGLGVALISAVFLVAGTTRSAAGADLPVDLELVLAVDVSGSINTEHAHLQRSGYARALTDHRVVDAIQSGSFGRIALTYVEWADDSLQRTIVEWRVIDGPGSAKDFARRLGGAPTVTEARTSISALIDYCVPLFAGNGFEASRHVIDVSGDGENNVGRSVTLARDEAVKAGITINGLPIVREGLLPWDEDRDHRRNLDAYYRDSVIGGPGAFVVVVKDYNGFADAIIAKLLDHRQASKGDSRASSHLSQYFGIFVVPDVLYCVSRIHSTALGHAFTRNPSAVGLDDERQVRLRSDIHRFSGTSMGLYRHFLGQLDGDA